MIEAQFTVHEVAKILRMSEDGVYLKLNRGALRHSKPARKILIPESALHEFLKAGEGKACKINRQPVQKIIRRKA